MRGTSYRQMAGDLIRQEKGSVPLKKSASVRMALVYPNTYAVGMANMGFQTVYRLFNLHPDVRCERAFLMEAPYDRDMRTLESGERLNRFDVIGFSLSFELDFPNMLRCLLQSGISVPRGERKEKDPLIVLGGAVAGLNPSPLLPFMDGLLVGEGEGILYQIADIVSDSRKKRLCREETLGLLSELDGFFVPGMTKSVVRHIQRPLDVYPTYTPIVTPYSHFENMFVVEVSRGCPQGCFFCAACKIYHPYRFRSLDSVMNTVKMENPGAQRVGLEGAGLSDYPELEKLFESVIKTGHSLSISSIRPNRIQPDLVRLMERGGVRTVTMAPEAGSEDLRRCIGKKIKDEQLLTSIRLLAETSIKMIKLYFIIGLPGETEDDIDAVIQLVKDSAFIFCGKRKRGRMRISLNAFIPKPFTEFQWSPMFTEKELSRKRTRIRQGLRDVKGVDITTKSTRQEILQGVLSLGDESVGQAMLDAVQNNVSWKQAFKRRDLDVSSILHAERHIDTPLPWDFIESEVPRKTSWTCYQEYRKECA